MNKPVGPPGQRGEGDKFPAAPSLSGQLAVPSPFQRLGRWRRGLSAQFLAFTILPLVLLLAFMAFESTTIHQDAMRLLVASQDERVTHATATALSESLRRRVVALQGLADRATDGRPPAAILTQSGYLAPDFDGGLAFFTPEGELLAASKAQADWDQRLITATLASALARNEPVFVSSPAEGEAAFLLAVPATNRTVIAMGAFSMQSWGVAELANRLGAGSHATTFILDKTGQILFQSGPGRLELDKATEACLQTASCGDSGTTYTYGTGDAEYVVVYSLISPTGWALITQELWADSVDPRLRISLLAPLVLVSAIVLAVAGLWLGLRRVVRPIQNMEKAAAQVAWGNFGAIETPVKGIAEIAELQATLQRMARRLRAYQEGMRDYMAAMIQAQEDERKRLARELHDDTLQAMIALDQRVQAAQRALSGGTGAAPDKLAEVRRLTGEMIESLRRFMGALRPIYLEDLGLIPALEMLVRDARRGALEVSFQVTGQARRLLPEQELTLYRIAQAALSNVIRHAGAAQARVNLEFTETGITITVEDNGRGFVAPERVSDLAHSGHFGLMGMQERAELIGAQLTIDSRPGQGTVVSARCDYAAPKEHDKLH